MDLKPIAMVIVNNLNDKEVDYFRTKYVDEVKDYVSRIDEGEHKLTFGGKKMSTEEWFKGYLSIVFTSRLRRLLIIAKNVDFIILEHVEAQLRELKYFDDMKDLEKFVGIQDEI